jgi:hypothetical protein
VDTNALIQQLAGTAAPVRRLAPPWRRAAIWFAISIPYAVAVILVQPLDFGLWQMDARFLIEQIATAATAVTAAIAAFCSIVPGFDRRLLWLPLAPLAVWLAALGEGCLQDWLHLGSAGLQVRPDWGCLPGAIMIGTIPAIVIVVMLARGAPLVPRATLALAAVAVAALTNFAMRMHHYGDISIMILFWHLGTVLVLAFIAGFFGRRVLKWRRIKFG